jgi:hypothetical protein
MPPCDTRVRAVSRSSQASEIAHIAAQAIHINRKRRCIRLKLYSSKQEEFFGSQEATVDDVVDFPLGRNGDLDFERVKLWWGIKICAVRDFEAKNAHSCFLLSLSWRTTLIDDDMAKKLRDALSCCPSHHWQALEPYNCNVFQQADPNKISGIAIHNLTAGRQNAMDLICNYCFSFTGLTEC